MVDHKHSDDSLEKPTTKKSILLSDLDKKNRDLNPKDTCVITIIDSQYTAAVNTNKRTRKFQVKSDVIKLRDITRNTFFIYVTQQRALEKTREQQLHSMIYRQTRRLVKISSKQLNVLKNQLFSSVIAESKNMETFLQLDTSDELKQHVSRQQKLSIEVTNIQKRLLFLLKLIDYFCIDNDAILEGNRINSDFAIINDSRVENIDACQIVKLKEFVTTHVKPYLNEQTFANAKFRIEGYTNIRLNLFNYYKKFTGVAIHHHLFSIMYSKFIEYHSRQTVKPVTRNTPQLLVSRAKYVEQKTLQLLDMSKPQHMRSNISLRIEGLAPVIIKRIRQEEVREKPDRKNNGFAKLEEIHTILMEFLAELDNMEACYMKAKESEIRKMIAREREQSRKVLIKVNRFQNWIEHYKKH